jgi:hypothetical protein
VQVLGLHRKHTYRGVDDLGKKDLSKSDRQEVDGNEKPKGIRVQDPWILHPTAVQPAPPVPGTAVGSTGAGSRKLPHRRARGAQGTGVQVWVACVPSGRRTGPNIEPFGRTAGSTSNLGTAVHYYEYTSAEVY